MVRHNFQRFDFNISFFGLCANELLEIVSNVANKARTTIFRAPNEVIVDVVNARFRNFILIPGNHTYSITATEYDCETKFTKIGQPIPPPIEIGGPLG